MEATAESAYSAQSQAQHYQLDSIPGIPVISNPHKQKDLSVPPSHFADDVLVSSSHNLQSEVTGMRLSFIDALVSIKKKVKSFFGVGDEFMPGAEEFRCLRHEPIDPGFICCFIRWYFSL